MTVTCVVGLQWGDEAKGKIVDLLAGGHDLVVRYNGGANAGHTVIAHGQTFKLSLLPSGILHPGVRSVIGNGVVVFPPRFFEEVAQLKAGGVTVGPDNLVLSDHAHVIFPYHMEEEEAVAQAIGTTRRGIGPCYADKIGRLNAIRVVDLLKPDVLRRRLEEIVPRKNRVLQALSPKAKTFDAGQLAKEYEGYADQLRPHVTDTTRLLQEAVRAGKRLLFEAAQGSLLDVDHGTYPYVTSSNSTVAGVWAGSGVPSRALTRVIGVLKAYTTRVGVGPFPTELTDATGIKLRATGGEFGVVTGRARRCGWFDAVAARYAANLNGTDQLALMKIDVLSVFDELPVGIAYEVDGDRIDHWPSDPDVLERCRVIYETLPGWRTDLTQMRKLADLPKAARRYLDRLAELMGLPIALVSVGPDREQTIEVG